MSTSDRARTLVKSLVSRRRFVWVPPNGRVMSQDEQVSIPGVLEDIVAFGMNVSAFDRYVNDLENDRVKITKIGYGSSGDEPTSYFSTIIGNGFNTIFDVDVGFGTASARTFLFDLVSGSPILFYQVTLSTPTSTSIRLTLVPAPASSQIQNKR
jgi:hypothetical protein